MGITGNISTMALADVFQWLATGQKTGTLRIAQIDGPIRKEIYFANGTITSASSNDPEELLGQFLMNTKRITEAQLTMALASQKKANNSLLGNILVEHKLLTKDELRDTLRTVTEEIIYDLFLWKEGNFEFADDQLPDREMPELGMDITHLSLEGAQREDDWMRIQDVFPDMSAVVKPDADTILANMPLDKEIAHLLGFVDGFNTLEKISRLFHAPKFQFLTTMLELHETGLIKVGDYTEQIIEFESPKNRNMVEDLLRNLRECMRMAKISEAERIMETLKKMDVSTPELNAFGDELNQKKHEQTIVKMLKPESIPVLKMSVDDITKMDLSPEQGFIVSRINGVWDVKSIARISPFDQDTCFSILHQFIKDGVITIK